MKMCDRIGEMVRAGERIDREGAISLFESDDLFGIGRLAASAMDGIARQPQAAGNIQTTMIYAHLAPDHLVDAVEKLGY